MQKAINLEIIKPQLEIKLNKTELNNLINEALENPETAAAVKRAITPLLAGSFPQFPEFTNISLGDTTEEGTIVTLKMPRPTKSDAPIASMEPLEVADEPDTETVTDTENESPAYVDPNSDDETDSADDSDVTGD